MGLNFRHQRHTNHRRVRKDARQDHPADVVHAQFIRGDVLHRDRKNRRLLSGHHFHNVQDRRVWPHDETFSDRRCHSKPEMRDHLVPFAGLRRQDRIHPLIDKPRMFFAARQR